MYLDGSVLGLRDVLCDAADDVFDRGVEYHFTSWPARLHYANDPVCHTAHQQYSAGKIPWREDPQLIPFLTAKGLIDEAVAEVPQPLTEAVALERMHLINLARHTLSSTVTETTLALRTGVKRIQVFQNTQMQSNQSSSSGEPSRGHSPRREHQLRKEHQLHQLITSAEARAQSRERKHKPPAPLSLSLQRPRDERG